MMANGVRVSFRIKPNDRIYITLPLYHTAGGIVGMGQGLLAGNTCVLRARFSATHFWNDCRQNGCTVALYIGEICRYLLAQPPSDIDKSHGVRMMYGNGLRPQIWAQFVQRFGIDRICELYGSTEGNTSILNIDNKLGACGFLTIYDFLTPIYPIGLVKVDTTSGRLIRDNNGLAIRCRPGDTGELVGTIVRGNPVKDFCGYVSEADTKRKVDRNVFRAGDAVFRSGDILYMDEYGYLYFKDRVGDSFRWKGENVSTAEVEGIIQEAFALRDAVVFGVIVPGNEGRAGMAAIVNPNGSIDLDAFLKEMSARLPKYAVPLFIRFCQHVNSTGTFKLIKTDLQSDGYDLNKCGSDALYYLNAASNKYELLDQRIYELILKEQIKF